MKAKLFLLLFPAMMVGSTCSTIRERPAPGPQNIATAWADMTLYVTKNTPANSPTYASRALGYIGLTMYESVVPGFPAYNSIATQLNGTSSLPVAEASVYKWELALNAGQAAIIKFMYNQTSDANKAKIDSLESRFAEQLAGSTTPEVTQRSIDFGRKVAEAIFEWSKTDGGHRGYLANFDKTYHVGKVPGCWEPPLYGQAISHLPLHPHWGDNRNFLAANHALKIPMIIKYSKDSTSEYFSEFLDVYKKGKVLTQEEKECALWWGDDPGETFTPPGHSYYLATLVIKKANPDLIKCAETYAKVGLAVGDAFINCWKWKYHFYSERPSSYISKNIDERWESFWPDPPFPAFPSGHATQAGAVAVVLSDLYGEQFEFTDDAHAGRQRDEFRNVDFKPRSFNTFWGVAEEIANSRFYGGIHSSQDNVVGLDEGAKIGRNINALAWKKTENYATVPK